MKKPNKRWTRPLARFGFAARGFVYLCLALLVLQLAGGRSGSAADNQGAFAAIARQPFGRILLFAVGAGLLSLALWSASRTLTPASGADAWSRRILAGGRAVLYLALGGSALAVVLAAHGGAASSGGDGKVVDITGRMMGAPAGRLLVGVVGVAIAIGGVLMGVNGLRKSKEEEINLGAASARTRRVLEVVGTVGMAARGLIFALTGAFIVQAAVKFDPAKAKGIDGVLRSLAGAPAGPWILVAVALGLASFGCFSIMESRYAKG